MSNQFSQLVALVPPPAKPVYAPSTARLSDIESRLNLTLPDDFKQIVQAYGAGRWQAFWFLYNPHQDRCFEDWRSPADHTSGTMQLELPYMREVRELMHQYGLKDWDFPIFPEEGGLLPWGRTENGGCLFWLTEGGQSRWPTIYFPDNRRTTFERIQLSCPEILVGTLSGSIQIGSLSVADCMRVDELFCPVVER